MTRFVILGLLIGSIVLSTDTQSRESSVSPISIEVAGLQDQLEKGLFVRRPIEFKFIAEIVAMVERRELTLEIVTGTFHWVRKHKAGVRYPFIYFEQALRKRALEEEGVNLPPLG